MICQLCLTLIVSLRIGFRLWNQLQTCRFKRLPNELICSKIRYRSLLFKIVIFHNISHLRRTNRLMIMLWPSLQQVLVHGRTRSWKLEMKSLTLLGRIPLITIKTINAWAFCLLWMVINSHQAKESLQRSKARASTSTISWGAASTTPTSSQSKT